LLAQSVLGELHLFHSWLDRVAIKGRIERHTISRAATSRSRMGNMSLMRCGQCTGTTGAPRQFRSEINVTRLVSRRCRLRDIRCQKRAAPLAKLKGFSMNSKMCTQGICHVDLCGLGKFWPNPCKSSARISEETGMNVRKHKALVAALQEALPKAPKDQALIRWVGETSNQSDETGPQRRIRLALRIAMIRAAARAIQAVPALQIVEPVSVEATEEPMSEAPVVAAPASEPPRKKARMKMSSVRLEDAALLLGAGFGDTDDSASDLSDKKAEPETE
jgi:hypothetical protein